MTKNRDLPPRCYQKHGAFFFVDKAGKWHPLGRDRDAALTKYATLTTQPGVISIGTVKGLVDTAMPLLLRGKAQSTQVQYNYLAKTNLSH